MPDPNQYPIFRLFNPEEWKIKEFARRLMEDYLYVDDQLRNVPTIHSILLYYLTAEQRNVLYEIGEFDGILAFTDILPGWKANMAFKLWNPKRWGPDFARQATAFTGEVMEELHIIRLETASPDKRMVKMAKMCGFEVEGVRKKGFSWGGQLYDEYLLARFREEE